MNYERLVRRLRQSPKIWADDDTKIQRLVSARRKGSEYEIPVYDDGFGSLFIHRNSIGISGIVRAQTWEDAYSICEDEFFPEANETVEQLQAEYGYTREHVKMIHPAIRKEVPVTFADGSVEAFNINRKVTRAATTADYELTGGKLLDGQFVRWDRIETSNPEAWIENELFWEAYGFRPNGPNAKDRLGHGIYAKDLNGDSLEVLTPELADALDIELTVEEWD